MQFKQFQSRLEQSNTGSEIIAHETCFGRLVQETVDGIVLVNRAQTLYSSLDEAIEHIKQQKVQEDIQKQIQQEVYEEMSDNRVADIIKSHHGQIRVTDTLIESYVELASSKLFTTDPVSQDIRKFNKLDRIIENHLDYVLNDGTKVVISEDAQIKLNNIFGKHQDVIEYMRENVDNFLDVLNQLEE